MEFHLFSKARSPKKQVSLSERREELRARLIDILTELDKNGDLVAALYVNQAIETITRSDLPR